MKKSATLIIIVAASFFCACNNEKAEEKVLLNEVISIHDKVMAKEDHLMQNKMRLDTLLMPGKVDTTHTIVDKATMGAFRSKLISADEAMEAWMQKFDPEQKGKSQDEKMQYFVDQKKIVLAIDSQFTTTIEASDKYLKGLKK